MLKWTDIASNGKTYSQIWNEGWQAGYNKAMSLTQSMNNSDFPKDFQHRGGTFWNGYAEGVISAESQKSKFEM